MGYVGAFHKAGKGLVVAVRDGGYTRPHQTAKGVMGNSGACLDAPIAARLQGQGIRVSGRFATSACGGARGRHRSDITNAYYRVIDTDLTDLAEIRRVWRQRHSLKIHAESMSCAASPMLRVLLGMAYFW